MKDLKFEQRRSVSRLEAAEQLMKLATALKEGGEIEWDIGHGTLSLRVPDELGSEIEVEIGDGKIELEIELEWPTARLRPPPSKAPGGTEGKRGAEGKEQAEGKGQAEGAEGAPRRRKSASAKPKRAGSGGRGTAPAKRSAATA